MQDGRGSECHSLSPRNTFVRKRNKAQKRRICRIGSLTPLSYSISSSPLSQGEDIGPSCHWPGQGNGKTDPMPLLKKPGGPTPWLPLLSNYLLVGASQKGGGRSWENQAKKNRANKSQRIAERHGGSGNPTPTPEAGIYIWSRLCRWPGTRGVGVARAVVSGVHTQTPKRRSKSKPGGIKRDILYFVYPLCVQKIRLGSFMAMNL